MTPAEHYEKTAAMTEVVADGICLAANGCKLAELKPAWRQAIMRRYARAAIAAMELTQEKGVRCRHSSEILVLKDGATHESFGINWGPLVRWVGPWQKDDAQ